jgi:hypothetical protein
MEAGLASLARQPGKQDEFSLVFMRTVVNGRVSEFGGRCRWWPRLVGDLALSGK